MTLAAGELSGVSEATEPAVRAFSRFEWVGLPEGAAALAAVVAAVAVSVAVVALYRRERAGSAGRLRWICCGLRIAGLGLLGVILLGPSRARDVERVRPGLLVLLADRSASMSIRDANLPDELARAWAEALGLPDPENVARLSRHEILRALLERDQAALIRRAARANQVEIVTFADDARTVLKVARRASDQGADAAPGQAGPAIPPWDPTGAATDLAGALRAALERTGPLAGVVVLTDGRQTDGGDLGAVAAELSRRDVPLHFVGIGSALAPKNVALVELFSGEHAVKGLPLEMRALVRSEHFAGRAVRVVLTATEVKSGRTEQVLSKSIVLESEAGRQPVDLTHVPSLAGTIRYEARGEPLAGESRVDDNSAATVVLVTDRKISVRLIAGAPSRDYRFLKSLIARDPVFDLAVLLQGDRPAAAGAGEFPRTREDLLTNDVIFLCDPSPADLSPEWAELLADLVDREGLGLVFAAGPTHTPELLGGPGLDRLHDLLPVVVDRARSRALIGGVGYFTENWPVELAEAGRGHLITNPGPEIEPVQFWKALAGLYWALPVERAKPGATVLLRCASPALRDRAGRGMVLAAVQPYGLGRVFWCGSPETWRWRRRGIEYDERFWLQALRYCAGGRPAGRRKRTYISLDRFAYALGEPVRVRARLLDSQFRPVQDERIELTVERDGVRVGAVDLQLTAARGALRRGLLPEQFGRFELAYTAPDGVRIAEPVEVRRPAVEFDDPRLARRTMEELAEMTGGRYFGPSELDELTAAIPDRSRTAVEPGPLEPLWDKAALLALLVAALCAEWLLRKRMGML